MLMVASIRGSYGLRGGAQDFPHGVDELRPGGRLGAQLRSACRRETVDLCFPIRVGEAPFALDPAAFLEPVESRIEGALSEVKNVVREFLRPPGDRVAVRRSPRECFQDEEIERALEQVEIGASHTPPESHRYLDVRQFDIRHIGVCATVVKTCLVTRRPVLPSSSSCPPPNIASPTCVL